MVLEADAGRQVEVARRLRTDEAAPPGPPGRAALLARPLRWMACRQLLGGDVWAARRTRSTPTSSPVSWTSEGYGPPAAPRRPTSSSSTPALSSRRPGRSRSATSSSLAAAKKPGARLVVTGCMAERYGQQLAERSPRSTPSPASGCLSHFSGVGGGANCPASTCSTCPARRRGRPWAYVKVAEGCDRRCGFCAIPRSAGPQRSRSRRDILAEVEALGGPRGGPGGPGPRLVGQGRQQRPPGPVPRAGDAAAHGPEVGWAGAAACATYGNGSSGCGCSTFTLRASRDELIDADRGERLPVLRPVAAARLRAPPAPHAPLWRRGAVPGKDRGHPSALSRGAALRSSFIVGYPGETEEDHDALLAFLEEAQLDWAGFFAFSRRGGDLRRQPARAGRPHARGERISECTELQDAITACRRSALVGSTCRALVDGPGQARSHREAPEIDGVIRVPRQLPAGAWVDLRIVGGRRPRPCGRAGGGT